jgi:hypothetical protein
MQEARLDRRAGYRLPDERTGPAGGGRSLARLDALAPGFPDWIVMSLFGGTYQREGLALRNRRIATLSAYRRPRTYRRRAGMPYLPRVLPPRIAAALGEAAADAIRVDNPARALAARWPEEERRAVSLRPG